MDRLKNLLKQISNCIIVNQVQQLSERKQVLLPLNFFQRVPHSVSNCQTDTTYLLQTSRKEKRKGGPHVDQTYP